MSAHEQPERAKRIRGSSSSTTTGRFLVKRTHALTRKVHIIFKLYTFWSLLISILSLWCIKSFSAPNANTSRQPSEEKNNTHLCMCMCLTWWEKRAEFHFSHHWYCTSSSHIHIHTKNNVQIRFYFDCIQLTDRKKQHTNTAKKYNTKLTRDRHIVGSVLACLGSCFIEILFLVHFVAWCWF